MSKREVQIYPKVINKENIVINDFVTTINEDGSIEFTPVPYEKKEISINAKVVNRNTNPIEVTKITYDDGSVKYVPVPYNKRNTQIFTSLKDYKRSESEIQAEELGNAYNNFFIISEDSYLERVRYNTLLNTYTVTQHPIQDSSDIIAYAKNLNAEDLTIDSKINKEWEIYGRGSSAPETLIGIDNEEYVTLSYIVWDNVKFLSDEPNQNMVITEQNS